MKEYSYSLSEFENLTTQGNLIPLFKQVFCDMDSPVSLFLKWGCDEAEHSFLLDSVEGGDKIGRHSFMGKNPKTLLYGKDGLFYLETPENGEKIEFVGSDPLDLLEYALGDSVIAEDSRLPNFQGGAVGFLSYSAVRYFENIPDTKPDDENAPDVYFGIYDEFLVIDQVEHVLKIVVLAAPNGFNNPKDCYEAAIKRIDGIDELLKSKTIPPEILHPESKSGLITYEPNISDEDYKNAVLKAQEYIRAGDIFQVVPSRKVHFKPEVHPFQIYRGLRTVNPSPYMYYLKLGETRIIGSSPEILVKYQNGETVLRPIAGTRPRGKTKTDDTSLEENLLADPKEIAEHIMLVDLGRNDLGRVCRPGSVRVSEFKVVEKYSHVMHIVSQCVGELDDEYTVFDLLKACLPAGTVTGAPKIRAMEIIDELEPTKRSIYAGSLGYVSYTGDMDMAIIIRTIIFYGEDAYLQAGGGVVLDSVPELELEETKNKMAALLKAVDFARKGLKGDWK